MLFTIELLLATRKAYAVIVMRLKWISVGRLTGTNTDNQQAEMVHLNRKESQATTVVRGPKHDRNGNRTDKNKTDELAPLSEVKYADTRSESNEAYGILHNFCLGFSIIKWRRDFGGQGIKHNSGCCGSYWSANIVMDSYASFTRL